MPAAKLSRGRPAGADTNAIGLPYKKRKRRQQLEKGRQQPRKKACVRQIQPVVSWPSHLKTQSQQTVKLPQRVTVGSYNLTRRDLDLLSSPSWLNDLVFLNCNRIKFAFKNDI